MFDVLQRRGGRSQVRYRIPVGSPKRRLFWQFVVLGSVIGAGGHTLLILIVGLTPRSGDDRN